MTQEHVITAFNKLRKYCEEENFKGWDPYDGLNSRLFQSVPFLKNSAICRLIMIQLFKRSPINLRPLFLVPKDYNAKGIGLFLKGYCNLYKALEKNSGKEKEIEKLKNDTAIYIRKLANLLLNMQSRGYSGACWGYNFDWQARRLFLFPAHTPTAVATTFCASALLDAYEITGSKEYLHTALSSADFILNDLHRTPCNDGFLFSYSPLQGNDTVFNASLLGSKLLSLCYLHTSNPVYKRVAAESVLACCRGQQEDGSWVYGLLPVQGWIDSFHTGYNLEALMTYQECTGDHRFEEYIRKGTDFYLKNFFLEDGTPRYYHNKTYPIDIHCPGQLFVTLAALHRFAENKELADKVLKWTLTHMQDKKGYFYYQQKKGINSSIPYMRWSNAFMFHALSVYLLETTT